MLQEIIFGFILADSTAVQAKDVVRIILCAENLHREFDIFPFSPDACAFLRNVQRKCVRSDLGAGSSAEGVHGNIPYRWRYSFFTCHVPYAEAEAGKLSGSAASVKQSLEESAAILCCG